MDRFQKRSALSDTSQAFKTQDFEAYLYNTVVFVMKLKAAAW